MKFTLEQATKAEGGVEVWIYSFLNLSTRWEWVVNAMYRPLYPRERPGTHYRGGWVGPTRSIGNVCCTLECILTTKITISIPVTRWRKAFRCLGSNAGNSTHARTQD